MIVHDVGKVLRAPTAPGAMEQQTTCWAGPGGGGAAAELMAPNRGRAGSNLVPAWWNGAGRAWSQCGRQLLRGLHHHHLITQVNRWQWAANASRQHPSHGGVLHRGGCACEVLPGRPRSRILITAAPASARSPLLEPSACAAGAVVQLEASSAAGWHRDPVGGGWAVDGRPRISPGN